MKLRIVHAVIICAVAGIIGIGALVWWADNHDQRQCASECLQARIADTPKRCAWICKYRRRSTQTVVVPMPIVH